MAKMFYRRLELPPLGTNCYIVGSEQTRDGMIIDPAGDARRILNNISQLQLNIGIIIITHAHPDHIGALSIVKDSTGATFATHRAEVDILQRYNFNRFASFEPNFKPPPMPDRILEDGDSIMVGDLMFLVLHTPGHSPGGICIYGHGVVFSGDSLFNMSIGRTDGPGGNYSQLITSIHKKLLVLPDNTVVLPGHGPKTTIGIERHNNPFLQ